MLDQYPPGSVCQPGIYHVALTHAATLRSADLPPEECVHRLYVTTPEGLPYLLQELPVLPADGEQLSITKLSSGFYKLNGSRDPVLLDQYGRRVGPTNDPNAMQLFTEHILGQEPPEPVVERIRISDPLPSETPPLLLSPEGGPVVGAEPEAPTLVSGQSKAGKTTVVAAMLASMPEVPAVWIAGEGKHQTRKTLRRFGAHRTTLYDLPVPGKSFAKTAELVAEDAPQLAVLDPYGIAATMWGFDTNSDTTPYSVLRLVQEVVGGIPVVIIAHDRKSQQWAGPALDQVRGSSALVGQAAVIHRVSTADDGRSHVRTIGYRYDKLPAPWTLDLATGEWFAASPAEALRDLILSVLEAAEEPMSCRGISDIVKRRVRVADLEKLADEGLAHKVSGGRGSGHRWLSGPPPPDTLL